MKRINVGDFRIGREEKQVINEVLDSGRISEGSKVREFEKNFGEYIGTKYAITLNSGTSSLIAGLIALRYNKNLNVRLNTKVITTPLTFIATSNAIVISGFEPVYVDVDPETFVITPENIKTCLENGNVSEYSIILPVHLMGYPVEMDDIDKIAKDYDMVIFEDAAQAHGTIYKGKKVGSWGNLADFSFYIAHNIQAGEMGAIVTDDSEISRLVRKLKAHGRMCDCPVCMRAEGKCPRISRGSEDSDPRFTHDLIGYNFKTMEFQAAFGISQLKKADRIMEKRSENVKYLNENLSKFSDVLQLPKYDKNISYLAYPLVIKNPERISRKMLSFELEKKGVETRPLFGCIPTQQPAYNHLKKDYKGKLPIADHIGKNGFYIGCHQYLEQDDLDYIINTMNEIL